ncbi:thioredoxin-disulfide reductase [Clostridium beijerinckii]|jgi:Thioredoxin reductase|uniref:Thioredoxin reductase n=2 Tax=Clostridium beijerinckii TaxID=1520 RepID=A0AAE2RTY4_CLOBE|nr:thioredoxin-disulfide reductase [Clostridium beijerinckii]ABR35455.1 FAD-dependent pyridine nucleotide-disulphide oxidoreductase [Clostridium beijerinckii NCIMB 8052]AIU02249.1 FAD-dependent pyridine nucleotide-disulfide oxidoreductase [Clostridium beijerinckii ATCC 35702]MBF7809902.1 thioredoxin-disulfide reductase [Clostridium beijerinckii]NOW90481.1 thioredoxin reductase (NADPH) [Clostridium beijerinckii]NRT69304.1 thioredoxin reductase (NADPH) [Clostridium beijerinckii]
MDDMTNFYDLIIIGGGPAGLSAAIYGGRAKLKTLVINKGVVGGLVNTTREIVNYPGYEQISGPELMKNFKKHAESFGVEFLRDEVVDTNLSLREKLITTKKGKQFLAKAIIIACGSEPRSLNISGEKRLKGNGVAYCATCDAEFFEGEHVVVVGSGDQAIEEGLYITKFARKVTVIVLHDEGILDCNKVSSERALNNEKIEFIWNSTIEEVLGTENVEGVKIKNLKTGNIEEVNCQGVFFFVGMVPSTNFLKNSGLEVDSRGYISANELMETSFEGVYAIGDNRVKYLRQVVSAAGDGATAAVAAERYIEELNDFNESILKSEKRVLLLFLDALVNENLRFRTLLEEVNRELVDCYRIKEVNIATKKNLIGKYNVRNVPEIIVLDHGNEIKRLKYTMDKEQLKSQLS